MSATAALQIIGPQPVDATQNELIAKFKITFASIYDPTSKNGDTLNLADARLTTTQLPTQVDIFEAPPAGTAPTGYAFYYCPGTNLTNGRICVMQGASAAPNTQITQNSAYPAALTATTYIYALVTIPSL